MKLRTNALRQFYVTMLVSSLMAGAAGANEYNGAKRNKPDFPRQPLVKLQKKVNAPSPNMNTQNSSVSALETKVKTLDTNVSALTGRVKNAEGSLSSLNAGVNALATRVESIEVAIPKPQLVWISHLDARPREAHGLVTSNGTPIGTTSGFVIRPVALGVDRVLEQGLQVPPGFAIKKIALCYQASSAASYITHLKLTQMATPDAYSDVLNDPVDMASTLGVCVDSMDAPLAVDPARGPVRLNIGVTFTDLTHLIMIRAIGLYLEPIGF